MGTNPDLGRFEFIHVKDILAPRDNHRYPLSMPELIQSQWWRPTEPSKVLAGVLFQDDDQRWMLHLDGSFEEPPSATPTGQPVPITLPDSFPVLLGLTSANRYITAFGCDTQGGSFPLFGRGSLQLRPTVIAHDVHSTDEAGLALTSLSVRYSNLDIWAATSGFAVQYPTASPYPVHVAYSIPDPVEAELPDGLSLRVSFCVAGPSLPVGSELHMVQRAWVTVMAREGRRYEDLLRCATGFADFIALAVGQPLRPLEMSGTCNASVGGGDQIEERTMVIVDNREPIAPEKRDVAVWDMVFSLNDIRSRFAEIVQAWFTKSEAIRPLYDLYFGTLRSPFMYVEQRFLNMFQALESYDRRTRITPPDKVQAHQGRLDRILGAVEAADAAWLKGQLRHSVEPGAEQRIRELTEQHSADWLLDIQAIKLAADMRNFHTHFSPEVEKRLPPKEDRVRCMHNLAVRLQVLCEVILLRLIGFPDVRQQIEKVRRLERRGAR